MSNQIALCRSRSKFGRCGLDAGHGGDMHAVEIGDGVWFGYRSYVGGSTRIGYGRFELDGWHLLPGEPTD